MLFFQNNGGLDLLDSLKQYGRIVSHLFDLLYYFVVI